MAVEPGSAGAIPVRVVAGGGPLGVDAGLVELAAGGRIVGAAYPVCGAVVDENGIYRLVYRASGDPAGAGDNELVAARGAGIRIRVLSAYLLGTAAVNGILRSATTAITGTFALTTPLMLPHNPHGWCQTAANEALNLNLSGAVATGAILTWVEAT